MVEPVQRPMTLASFFELHEVPAVSPLFADDAGTGDCDARSARTRQAAGLESADRAWPCADVLLPAARAADSQPGDFVGWFRYGRVDFLLNVPPSLGGPTQGFPPDYGYNVAIVYLIWIAIVLALYPICRWFAGVKQRNRSAVLSYF